MNKFVTIILVLMIIVVTFVAFVSRLLPLVDQPRSADAIIAISGGDTNARAQKAIELFQQDLAPQLVFAGAAEDPSSRSNAFIMRRTAIRSGISPASILIDEKSVNTTQNAENTKKLLPNANKIILVTSEYHQRRANKDFQKAFGTDVEIINLPAEDKHWNRSYWWLQPFGWWISITEPIKLLFT